MLAWVCLRWRAGHDWAAGRVGLHWRMGCMRPDQPRNPPPSCSCPPHTQEAALVKCLLLRASYGGMTGDMQMLRGYASYW